LFLAEFLDEFRFSFSAPLLPQSSAATKGREIGEEEKNEKEKKQKRKKGREKISKNERVRVRGRKRKKGENVKTRMKSSSKGKKGSSEEAEGKNEQRRKRTEVSSKKQQLVICSRENSIKDRTLPFSNTLISSMNTPLAQSSSAIGSPCCHSSPFSSSAQQHRIQQPPSSAPHNGKP
jgi:hypothetical protein